MFVLFSTALLVSKNTSAKKIWLGWCPGLGKLVLNGKNSPAIWHRSQKILNPKQNYSLQSQIRGLPKSVQGLNSSLAQLTAAVWCCKSLPKTWHLWDFKGTNGYETFLLNFAFFWFRKQISSGSCQSGANTGEGTQGMHPPTRPIEVLTWHLISLKIIPKNIFVLHITRLRC